MSGTVYLLHFKRPHKHARHYLGYTELTVEERLQRHRSGKGAKLLRAILAEGNDFQLARTWEDVDQAFERTLKNRKNAPARLCPICKAKQT